MNGCNVGEQGASWRTDVATGRFSGWSAPRDTSPLLCLYDNTRGAGPGANFHEVEATGLSEVVDHLGRNLDTFLDVYDVPHGTLALRYGADASCSGEAMWL